MTTVVNLSLQERYARKNEAADLRRAFELIDSKNDGRIDAGELAELFDKMKHKVKRVSTLATMPFLFNRLTRSFHTRLKTSGRIVHGGPGLCRLRSRT